jgi:hypothetical protein
MMIIVKGVVATVEFSGKHSTWGSLSPPRTRRPVGAGSFYTETRFLWKCLGVTERQRNIHFQGLKSRRLERIMVTG